MAAETLEWARERRLANCFTMAFRQRPQPMQNLRYLNHIPTGLAYLLRRERAWGQPVFFTIETINSCNFRCVYCPQSAPESHFVNGRGSMALEDFKRIIANLRSAFNVRIVSLHRDGEPLLNRQLEEFVSHLTGLGVYVTISSNCSLLPEARALSLVRSGLHMVGTDFCADPELYERMRVRGSWEATLDGIRNLLRAATAQKADFRVVIKDIAAHGLSAEAAEPLLEKTRMLFPEEERRRVTVTNVHFHNALGESLMNLSGRPDRAARDVYSLCHQPWANFTVDFAGRVVGCCRDLRSEYVVGDLTRQSAAEIWNSAPMRELRRALAERRPEQISICRACDVPWQGSYSGRTPFQKVRNFFLSGLWQR